MRGSRLITASVRSKESGQAKAPALCPYIQKTRAKEIISVPLLMFGCFPTPRRTMHRSAYHEHAGNHRQWAQCHRGDHAKTAHHHQMHCSRSVIAHKPPGIPPRDHCWPYNMDNPAVVPTAACSSCHLGARTRRCHLLRDRTKGKPTCMRQFEIARRSSRKL